MTLNPDLIRSRCAEIDASVQRLERMRPLSRQEFLADQDLLDIACHRLLIAIEAALSLCYHVSARRLRQAPENYAACFAALRESGLIPAALAERLQAMVRFRNLLVHVYWKVDYGEVHRVIQRDLPDLRAFAAVMAALI
jgi:uncharacterized protein YutE (UPF0331/DUF86 family)